MNRDERLETLLGEWNAATPDAGFEQRMLRGIEARRMTAGPKRRRLWMLVPVAGAVCACGLVLGISTDGVKSAPPAVKVAAAAAPQSVRVVPSMAAPRAVANRASTASEKHPEEPKMEANVSFPAPPMPLTEQEKLLRRIAHTGDPQVFATLNPEARADAEAEQSQAYEAYFASPPPSQDVLDTIKMQEKDNLR